MEYICKPEINVVYNQNLGFNILREIRPQVLKQINFEVALTNHTLIFSGVTKDLTKPILLSSVHHVYTTLIHAKMNKVDSLIFYIDGGTKLIEKVGCGQRRKKN